MFVIPMYLSFLVNPYTSASVSGIIRKVADSLRPKSRTAVTVPIFWLPPTARLSRFVSQPPLSAAVYGCMALQTASREWRRPLAIKTGHIRAGIKPHVEKSIIDAQFLAECTSTTL